LGDTFTINRSSKIKVHLAECCFCSHWFITPVPETTGFISLYGEGSEYVLSKNWKGKKDAFSIPEQFIIRQEQQHSRKYTSYLEIGIGGGLLFNYFIKSGFNCTGVEPGGWIGDRQNVVADIKQLRDKHYDVVVMGDVLEHIENPSEMLQLVSALVSSGTLYAFFPNNESLRARCGRTNWRMVRPFGHLHFFSKQSLTIMLLSNGFQIKKLQKTDLVDPHDRSNWLPSKALPMNIFMLLFQRHFGDQWIVQAEKQINN
jgi:2-polyprenyl-3-methyl-5-hydroxy-6-metoxy-1,4-benzoquinol methylase